MQFGYRINRIFISVPEYITRIYKKYESILTLSIPYRTPLAVNTRLSRAKCSINTKVIAYMSIIPYREVVGALLWVLELKI